MDNIKSEISIFKKLKLKLMGMESSFVKKINSIRSSEDYASLKGMLADIIAYGILLNFALYPWIGLSIWSFLGTGCGFFMIKEKIVPIIISILGSINLVRSYK